MFSACSCLDDITASLLHGGLELMNQFMCRLSRDKYLLHLMQFKMQFQDSSNILLNIQRGIIEYTMQSGNPGPES